MNNKIEVIMETQFKLRAMAISFLMLIAIISAYSQTSVGVGNIIGKVKLAGYQTEAIINSPELVISAKGEVLNVVITIEGIKGPFKKDPIVINQKNKAYNPRISAAMMGNEITFINSDELLHNVHTLKNKNETIFNVIMPKANMSYQYHLESTGLMTVRCDVHPVMIGYVIVTDNPYYAVTNEVGLFRIDQVPTGTYRVKAWHEKLGSIHKEVTITNGKKVALIFEFPSQNIKL